MQSAQDKEHAIRLFQEVMGSRLSIKDAVIRLRSSGDELLEAIENLVVEPEYDWIGLSDQQFAKVAIEAIQCEWTAEEFLQFVERELKREN